MMIINKRISELYHFKARLIWNGDPYTINPEAAEIINEREDAHATGLEKNILEALVNKINSDNFLPININETEISIKFKTIGVHPLYSMSSDLNYKITSNEYTCNAIWKNPTGTVIYCTGQDELCQV